MPALGDDDLGSVAHQAEGDAELAAADRGQGRETDPLLPLQAGRVAAEELDLQVQRLGDIADGQLTGQHPPPAGLAQRPAREPHHRVPARVQEVGRSQMIVAHLRARADRRGGDLRRH